MMTLLFLQETRRRPAHNKQWLNFFRVCDTTRSRLIARVDGEDAHRKREATQHAAETDQLKLKRRPGGRLRAEVVAPPPPRHKRTTTNLEHARSHFNTTIFFFFFPLV